MPGEVIGSPATSIVPVDPSIYNALVDVPSTLTYTLRSPFDAELVIDASIPFMLIFNWRVAPIVRPVLF